MKITFSYKDKKNVNRASIKEFLVFWIDKNAPHTKNINISSPEKILGKGADYFVPNLGLLIEETQLIDNDDLAKGVKWSLTVNTLSKLLKENSRFSEVKGLFSVSTPENFGLKSSQLKNQSLLNTKIKKAVETILDAIISGVGDTEVFGYKIKIQKVNDVDCGIYFSTMGGGHSINVAGIFHNNLKNKFAKANIQLSLEKIEDVSTQSRILLIVNRYKLLTFDWDLFEGLSYSYKELVGKYKHIDEIWFQVEDGEGKFHHKLLYKKSLFEQFENMDFSNMKAEDYAIFAQWFSALEKLDEGKKQNLIEALKLLLNDKSPQNIFPESLTRIEMVRYGRWLAENNKMADANWLVTKFINDPDPSDPPTDEKDNFGNQLHQRIKEATKTDVQAIYTVKGHLAWTVQMLAVSKDYIKQAYDYTQQVLRTTKHLYLILQWAFPLMEISQRRLWLKEIDEESYKDLKILSFELLNKYSMYPDIAKSLVHIFSYIKDLTTKEVKEVLDKLINADDYEALLLYYAVYRERHFKDLKYDAAIREYDPTYAKNKLYEVIKSNDKKMLNLRSGLAWNIWSIISNEEDEFETLSPLIEMFFITDYDNHLFHNFERIIEEQFDKRPAIAIEWFNKIIRAAKDYLEKNPDEGRNVWLGIETGNFLEKIAKTKPDLLLEIVKSLQQMWMKGAFVGTISEIFESYKSIDNPILRSNIKKEFQKLYAEMKAVNEKLQTVDWK